MRSAATDVLEAHANLLPMTLLLQNTCHQAIIRLAAHPDTHPLHAPIRRAAGHYVSSHRSSLHRLTHFFKVQPTEIKALIPARRAPTSNLKCPYKTHIAVTRESAAKEHHELQDKIQVYSDGSGHDGKIGAAAILFCVGAHPRTLCYYLGTDKEHTVYEAEMVGLTLAAKLLATERDLIFPLSISVDNQEALLSGESFQSNPGSYLATKFQ